GSIFFFFFQAEDGIRDSSVTGVQTCALPIYAPMSCELRTAADLSPRETDIHTTLARFLLSQNRPAEAEQLLRKLKQSLPDNPERSEERRVGKGCRCRRRG